MSERNAPTWFKILTVVTYLLGGLVILAVVAAHTPFLASWFSAHGLSTAVLYLQNSFFKYEIVAALILVIDTVLFGSSHVTSNFPSGLTTGTLVYNDLIFVGSIFLMYHYDSKGVYFPYPLIYIIPVIIYVLCFVFLIDDWVRSSRKAAVSPSDVIVSDEWVAASRPKQSRTRKSGAKAAAETAEEPAAQRPMRIISARTGTDMDRLFGPDEEETEIDVSPDDDPYTAAPAPAQNQPDFQPEVTFKPRTSVKESDDGDTYSYDDLIEMFSDSNEKHGTETEAEEPAAEPVPLSADEEPEWADFISNFELYDEDGKKDIRRKDKDQK